MQQMFLPGLKTLPPPLKWAGGKRWLVPEVRTFWAQHRQRRLAEPFVGGMAIALGLSPGRAILNDANPHLINFYKWLQRGLVPSITMSNDKEIYYRYRSRFNELVSLGRTDDKEAADLFYYLNRTGFNGLCRFNSKGEFNVPFGSYTTIKYMTDFSEYRDILGNWEFHNCDFYDLTLDAADFIYADPPYDVPFTTYSAGGFSWGDQLRLAEWLAVHPGPIVVSNQATERILDLYAGYRFDIRILDAPRMISCTGDRTPAKEMLATKGL